MFPDFLKQSLVKPIHKKGSKCNQSYYRPIALLPVASKVFEKPMCNRLYSFCENYDVFHESQNGFPLSTTLATNKFMQKIQDALNDQKY